MVAGCVRRVVILCSNDCVGICMGGSALFGLGEWSSYRGGRLTVLRLPVKFTYLWNLFPAVFSNYSITSWKLTKYFFQTTATMLMSQCQMAASDG